MSISVLNKTKKQIPSFDINGIKDAVLGSSYELSVAYVEPKEIQDLNHSYRNKDEVTDILSFPLSDSKGEIIICPEDVERQCGDFGRTYDNFFAFLFIHGCTHLKGYDHGDKMERLEEKVRKQFHI